MARKERDADCRPELAKKVIISENKLSEEI